MKLHSALLTAAMMFALAACGNGSTDTSEPVPSPSPPPPAPGTLDATFGQGGMVVTTLGSGHSADARAVAIAPDGKIVLAGFAVDGEFPKFALARYNADGSPDVSFGRDGTVLIGPGSGASAIYAVALQADGRIVVAGSALLPGTADSICAVARFNADGTLDGKFGVGGIVLVDRVVAVAGVDHRIPECVSVAVQPDGRIVAAAPRTHVVVVRLNPDGTADRSFGADGATVIPDGLLTCSIGIRPDGRIDLVGVWPLVVVHTQGWGLLLARFTPDGRLDDGFGGQGLVRNYWTGSLQSYSRGATNFAYAPEGKTVAALGWIFRFLPSGALDLMMVPPSDAVPNNYYVQSVALQRNGKIVGAATPGFRISRLLPDGRYDTDFGDRGMVETIFPGDDRGVNAIAVQADGKIVAAGQAWSYVLVGMGGRMIVSDFAMARYHGDPVVAGAP